MFPAVVEGEFASLSVSLTHRNGEDRTDLENKIQGHLKKKKKEQINFL